MILPFLLEGCRNKSADTADNTVEETAPDTLPGDFVAFFNRFHSDSQFQMDHIIFPLEGLPPASGDEDTIMTDRYFWSRDDWKIHHHFTDPSNQFEHWYEVLDTRIIEHWIQMKGTNLVMRRRFARLDDDWFLIYYSALRPVKME